MPIYEYNCRRCDHRFEAIVLSSARKNQLPRVLLPCYRKAIVRVQRSGFRQQTSGFIDGRWLRLHAADLRLSLRVLRRGEEIRQVLANSL